MLIKNTRHVVLKYKILFDFQGNLAVRLKLWNFCFFASGYAVMWLKYLWLRLPADSSKVSLAILRLFVTSLWPFTPGCFSIYRVSESFKHANKVVGSIKTRKSETAWSNSKFSLKTRVLYHYLEVAYLSISTVQLRKLVKLCPSREGSIPSHGRKFCFIL